MARLGCTIFLSLNFLVCEWGWFCHLPQCSSMEKSSSADFCSHNQEPLHTETDKWPHKGSWSCVHDSHGSHGDGVHESWTCKVISMLTGTQRLHIWCKDSGPERGWIWGQRLPFSHGPSILSSCYSLLPSTVLITLTLPTVLGWYPVQGCQPHSPPHPLMVVLPRQ